MKKILLTLALGLFLAPALLCASAHDNPIVLGKGRITLITSSLFRLEFSDDAKFIDEPTLFAYNRDSMLAPDKFQVNELGDGKYEIVTDDIRIWVWANDYPWGQCNFKVHYKVDGKERVFYNRELFTQSLGEVSRNLGGSVETVDKLTKPMPLNDGILTRNGCYVVDDEGKDVLVNGWIQARNSKNHIQDQYCFIYGNDYKKAFRDLGAISGQVPMTRKYLHGVWYCRYWSYTSKEFLEILDGYDKNDFPIDNLVFDMGWHTNDATIGTGSSNRLFWTGYKWNTELIPDPKALIDEIHSRRITVSVNDHPHDGIRPNESNYKEFMAVMGADPAKPVLFDISDKKYVENFFKYAHRPNEELGVDFWWLDWQQNYVYPKVRGLQTATLPWLNELYYRDSERGGLRGCTYSRFGGLGDQRHPFNFSGDSRVTWPMLAFEVKLSSHGANGGCYYWAHDIGGFNGNRNPELTVRWTQFGALSAALRVHSTNNPKLDRRPWLDPERYVNVLRSIYHMRSQLMPYVYTSVWQVHNTMIPLNRAMYIEYPYDEQAYENEQEYLFGDLILAAPITSPGTGEDHTASQKVWFPRGDVWYDWFTGEKYNGGTTAQISKKLEEFPMYVKGGWILPMMPYSARPATEPLANLVMRVWPASSDADNTYTLYEDDGITNECDKGAFAKTALRYQQSDGKVTVTVNPTEGEYKGQVLKRAYTLELKQFSAVKSVKVNGRKAKMETTPEGQIVSIKASDIRKSQVIELQF